MISWESVFIGSHMTEKNSKFMLLIWLAVISTNCLKLGSLIPCGQRFYLRRTLQSLPRCRWILPTHVTELRVVFLLLYKCWEGQVYAGDLNAA